MLVCGVELRFSYHVVHETHLPMRYELRFLLMPDGRRKNWQYNRQTREDLTSITFVLYIQCTYGALFPLTRS